MSGFRVFIIDLVIRPHENGFELCFLAGQHALCFDCRGVNDISKGKDWSSAMGGDLCRRMRNRAGDDRLKEMSGYEFGIRFQN